MLRLMAKSLLMFGGFVDPVRTKPAAYVEPIADPEPPPSPVRRTSPVPTLGEACRRYQEAALAWRLDRLDNEELARLRIAMGAELYAWVRVQVATGDRYTWRPTQGADPSEDRRSVAHAMRRDIGLWERALAEIDRQAAIARRLRRTPPEPLVVPADIVAAIAARRVAAEERAKRRAAQGKPGEGGDGDVPKPAPPSPRGPRR